MRKGRKDGNRGEERRKKKTGGGGIGGRNI